MKYEFHVGDYVEMTDGFVGWICQVEDDDCICVTDKYVTGYYRIPEELRYFNRIGQYDFTKKDEGEIEPLCEEYTKSFPICKTTTTGNDSEWRNIDIGAVGKKINELVEAVNSIKKELNNG